MNIRFLYYLVSLCIFISSNAKGFAQSATITIKVLNNEQLTEDLNCYWFEDNFEFFNRTPLVKKMAFKKDSVFTISFEKNTRYRYITLKTDKKENFDKILFLDFLICPGDEIIVTEDDNGLKFTGNGAGKFTVQYQINKIDKAIFLLDENKGNTYQVSSELKLSTALHERLESLLQSAYSKRDSIFIILENNKDEVGSEVYSLLKLNVIGKAEQILLKNLYMVFYRFSKDNPALSKEKPLLLKEYLSRNTRINEVSSSMLLYANEMQNYLMTRFKYNKWLGASFYEEWNEDEIGQSTKDRVLYRYFYQNYSKMDSTQRAEIIGQISDDKYKMSIKKFLHNISYAAIVPDFQFQDSLGNDVHLSDFRGKVIVLDFWYTGCGNCRILNEDMKPLKLLLNHRKDIVFLNVSIDGDFDKWKKSVSTGDYTDTSDISLFTMGKRSTHPIVAFFNVISFPRQVILDKNMRIFSTHVPRPGSSENNNSFLKLIEGVL